MQQSSLAGAWTGGWFSLWRATLGLVALAMGVTAALARARGDWPPGLFAPAALPATLVWIALAIGLLLGLATRPLTAPLALTILIGGRTELAGSGHALLLGLVVLSGATPRAPYGSWPARGRVDPGGGWRMPRGLPWIGWAVLALSQGHLAWTLAHHAGFGSGAALAELIAYLREGPGAAAGAPAPVALEWGLALAAGALVPLSLWRGTRPQAWLVALIGQLILAGLVLVPHDGAPGWGAAGASAATGLLFWLCFDPRWVAGAGPGLRAVYYDGHCGLCHGAIRFLLAEDRRGELRFAALQGETFARASKGRGDLPDSVIVETDDGTLLWKSAAARVLLAHLGGGWRVTGWLLAAVPRPLADLAYDGVAAVRHRIFARPADACPLLPPTMRGRFLP